MKHLIAALVLLLAIVGLTTANALTVVDRMEDFQAQLDALPDTEAEAMAYDPAQVDALYDAWRTRAAEAAYDLLAAEKFSLDNII